MNPKGPYRQRVEMRGNACFARTSAMTVSGQPVASKPDGADAFVNRGNMLREQGRYDEALASYEQAIALEPHHADAYFNRGTAFRELKRHEEALASFDRVIALRPNYVRAFNNRGNALQV